MDWMKIASALMLLLFIAVLAPRASQMMKESRKAEQGEWVGVVIPILGVVAFVLLLMSLV
ncbi:MAG: hypothetical protein KJO38_05035 [Gammaproteobacteria bacterium]|nr:hypothetical protein [Gammaproteobacteria bacterium]